MAVPAQEAKPFGMTMGASKHEVIKALKGAKVDDLNEFAFGSKVAIEMSPYFDRYMYTVTPETGLCAVTGFSKGFTDIYPLMAHYRSIKEALSSKYGKTSMSSEMGVKTILPIASAVRRGVIEVKDFWGLAVDSDANMVFNLESDTVLYIQLDLMPIGKDAVAVTLQYPFKNYIQCRESILKNQAKSL